MNSYKKEQTVIEIGEKSHKVEVAAFPARKAIKIQIKLARFIAPLLANIDTSDTSKITQSLNSSTIASALKGSLDEEKIEKLILELLEVTTIDNKVIGTGNEPQFDIIFAGEFGLLFDVIKFVLEVNFGSFLEKLGVTSKKEALQS